MRHSAQLACQRKPLGKKYYLKARNQNNFFALDSSTEVIFNNMRERIFAVFALLTFNGKIKFPYNFCNLPTAK